MSLENLSYEKTDWNNVQKSITSGTGQTLSGVFWKGTTTERTALGLDSSDEGLLCWDTTLKAMFIWNGTEFV